ncbi:PTS sugar transporter subunit IIA [Paeniglutamicibacter terrestris]|uniref:PTS sugar transporter subunit IIA n=1 Tax=Paeniglutamicibacter terrestris TaxID=2723403 RepID=A0ABX1G287_9MICC|nr:PTS sugar transporter subunit IIA [Paeniglutamicibacter terrestris]NKG20338.1 PTS sugar transporter subunit IIA [Paeniglutamicibacter terrestris]
MTPTLSPADDADSQAITTAEMVVLEFAAPSRNDAVAALAATLVETSRVLDLDGFLSDVRSYEHQLATALPGGVGVAHARSSHVVLPSIAVGVLAFGNSLDFGARDGDAHVVLLLATPATSYSEHLTMLAALARSLAKDSFRESLRRSHDPEVIAELVNSTVDFSAV